jgi:hypothetical protein
MCLEATCEGKAVHGRRAEPSEARGVRSPTRLKPGDTSRPPTAEACPSSAAVAEGGGTPRGTLVSPRMKLRNMVWRMIATLFIMSALFSSWPICSSGNGHAPTPRTPSVPLKSPCPSEPRASDVDNRRSSGSCGMPFQARHESQRPKNLQQTAAAASQAAGPLAEKKFKQGPRCAGGSGTWSIAWMSSRTKPTREALALSRASSVAEGSSRPSDTRT